MADRVAADSGAAAGFEAAAAPPSAPPPPPSSSFFSVGFLQAPVASTFMNVQMFLESYGWFVVLFVFVAYQVGPRLGLTGSKQTFDVRNEESRRQAAYASVGGDTARKEELDERRRLAILALEKRTRAQAKTIREKQAEELKRKRKEKLERDEDLMNGKGRASQSEDFKYVRIER